MANEAKGPFLTFLDVSLPSQTTKRFRVDNTHRNDTLGWIAWWAQWRRYVFSPSSGAVFDSNCMREISRKLDDLMEERKVNASS